VVLEHRGQLEITQRSGFATVMTGEASSSEKPKFGLPHNAVQWRSFAEHAAERSIADLYPPRERAVEWPTQRGLTSPSGRAPCGRYPTNQRADIARGERSEQQPEPFVIHTTNPHDRTAVVNLKLLRLADAEHRPWFAWFRHAEQRI
jgi:hypothetical protein